MPKTELEENLLEQAAFGNEGKREAIQVTEDARQKESASESFGGQLFLGNFAFDHLFPFPTQSEEDRKIGDAYLEKIKAFLLENLDPNEVDATRQIPKKVIQGLGELGAFALKVPKEYGGLGFSTVNYNRVIMLVASYCSSTAVLLSAHQSIGVPQPLKLFGTDEQKRKYLPRFRQGQISAFALTEPEVGSDPARLTCTATLSEDGHFYMINGTKLWCTNGTVADVIVLIAKTKSKWVNGKEKSQISAFIVEMNTPGVEVLHRCDFMGLKGIYNGVIQFTQVKIPKENLIGEEGMGLKMALATVNVGRLTLPAASCGGAKLCLNVARTWGNERVQWGMPVGMHEAGRAKIAYIAATTLAMEAIAWLTSNWADRGKDIRIEAAMAKYFCTEELWKIVDLTVQLRGGRGYETASSLKARGETPYPIERLLRDCRINTILEGTSEIMKLFLAREAMESHLELAKPLLSSKTSWVKKLSTFFYLIGHYSLWYPQQRLQSHFCQSYPQLQKLSKHYQWIEKQSHHLAYRLFGAIAKQRQNLEKRQLLLGRLMDIGTDLFAMAAVCSYAIYLEKEKISNESPIQLADYFCSLAKKRIQQHFYALDRNLDRQSNQLAKDALKDHYIWLESGIF